MGRDSLLVGLFDEESLFEKDEAVEVVVCEEEAHDCSGLPPHRQAQEVKGRAISADSISYIIDATLLTLAA